MGKVVNKVNRRLRTPNWSPDEKQYLLELISTRKEVVVTKSNNGPNFSEEKSVAWNEILQELETRFGTKFNGNPIKKVKTQWQNMKRLAREEIAQTGPVLARLTKQTVDVCQIIGMIKDGVLIPDPQNSFNETAISTNVEIKTERIDEEVPNCSGTKNNNNNVVPVVGSEHNKENVSLNRLESTSSASEPVSLNDSEVFENPNQSTSFTKKNASAMTDETYAKDSTLRVNPFHKEMQDYFKFISAEKLLKMESIKEERQVIRAMRETAELNKIIAEQKLKHVLWVKKTEMAMYSGELGSGAGKGGGGGGSIREAGGSFGKMEAAREEEYFYKKQKEQLKNLKGHLDKEISFHEDQIKRHQEAIARHKEQMDDIKH